VDDLPNELSDRGRQDACRRYVESAEAWLRKLADRVLSAKFGRDYITAGPWKKEIRERVALRIQQGGVSFQRQIDATAFEQLTDIVCRPDCWDDFRPGLKLAYPDGPDEARTFIDRIRSIRNDVSHGRQCSTRQLEQAICYGNDIADSIKEYFRGENLSREFNVPTFVQARDNLGNSEVLTPGDYFRGVSLSGAGRRDLFPGDVILVEVEVGPSFDEDDYEVQWWLKTPSGARGGGTKKKN
jgi:hypothetical protein